MSRNGTQLAVLSSDGESRTRIEVIGVTRDGQNRPTGTVEAAPLLVGAGLHSISDFSWAGPHTLVMLAAPAPGSPETPYRTPVAGPQNSLGSIDGGIRVTAGDDSRSLRVSTAAGEMYTYSAGNWQKLVDVRAFDPAYPG